MYCHCWNPWIINTTSGVHPHRQVRPLVQWDEPREGRKCGSRECRKHHFLSAKDNFLHLLIVISSTVVVGGKMQGTIVRPWQTLYPFFPMTI